MNRDFHYLSTEEKQYEMLAWNSCKTADPGMKQILQRLNDIDGVCTIQSCLGHMKHDIFGRSYIESAHVDLRLDEHHTKIFFENLESIKNTRNIEDVCLTCRSGYVIVRIESKPGSISKIVDSLIGIFQ